MVASAASVAVPDRHRAAARMVASVALVVVSPCHQAALPTVASAALVVAPPASAVAHLPRQPAFWWDGSSLSP